MTPPATIAKEKGPSFGPFFQAAEIIRERRGFPIPCGGEDGKEPLVKWRHVKSLPSRTVIADWRARFAEANVGILTGPSRLTVVDVDDADLLDDALAEHGETALIVCTPRGGFHLYYRSAGEATVTRKDGAPIDVRGIGGFVVAPPSVRPGSGAYRFVTGSWPDLEKLPTARAGSLPFAQTPAKVRTMEAGQKAVEGTRHDTLFRELLRIAAQCETEDELAFRAAGFNEAICDPPLTDGEVRATVRGVWQYKLDGRLWVGEEARAVLTRDEVLSLADESDALALLALLRMEHGAHNHAFSLSVVALASHNVLPGWGKHRYRRARDFLLSAGTISCVHTGGDGAGDPSLYRLNKGPEIGHNITRNPPLFSGWCLRIVPAPEAVTSTAPADLLALPLFGEVLPLLPTPLEALRQSVKASLTTAPRGEQTRLAAAVGVSRFQFSNFLAGRHRLNPPAEAVLRNLVSTGGSS